MHLPLKSMQAQNQRRPAKSLNGQHNILQILVESLNGSQCAAALTDAEAGSAIRAESGRVHTAFPLFNSTRFIVTFNC